MWGIHCPLPCFLQCPVAFCHAFCHALFNASNIGHGICDAFYLPCPCPLPCCWQRSSTPFAVGHASCHAFAMSRALAMPFAMQMAWLKHQTAKLHGMANCIGKTSMAKCIAGHGRRHCKNAWQVVAAAGGCCSLCLRHRHPCLHDMSPGAMTSSSMTIRRFVVSARPRTCGPGNVSRLCSHACPSLKPVLRRPDPVLRRPRGTQTGW